ncbi:MAG: hypothetical protein WBE58_16550 [Verrucomicrobiales bacterium]
MRWRKARARRSLLADTGLDNKTIAERLAGQSEGGALAQAGLPGRSKDKSRPGRIAPPSASVRSRIVKMALEQKLAGASNWSRKSMPTATGVSPLSVGRVWAVHGLRPRWIKGFKLSNDKRFEEKLEDMVGIYLS